MAHAQGASRRETAELFVTAGLATGFVCAAFAAAASSVVAVLYFTGSFGESTGFGVKILAKAVAFTIAAGLCLWILNRSRSRLAAGTRELKTDRRHSPWGFLPAALVAATLLFSNLNRHPWPAPDELHHLVVARNLAEHGAYASGLSPNLVWFDHYDSVGAPVIGLVAGAFKIFGVSLAPARAVLASFGVTLIVLVYFVFLPLFGARASGLASFFALAAFGTLYLARSLYGEVPALAFVLLGLLAWRRGLVPGNSLFFLIAAGLCFGLAVLTKTFMGVAALAVLGAYVFDRATYRRIPAKGILLPAVAALGVLSAWQTVEFAARHLVAEDKPSLALYYRHSLTFGLGQIWDNIGLIAMAIPALALAVWAMGAVVPKVFRNQYDPALAVLLFLAPLFVFWFAFFTPMHLPRYLWYPSVIAAMFCGPLVHRAMGWRSAAASRRSLYMPARVAIAGLVAWVLLVPAAEISYKVFRSDYAGPDQAVARYVATLPAGTRIATTYWPAERLLNFLGERQVTVLTPEGPSTEEYDVLIDSDLAEIALTSRIEPSQRFGHYVIYRRDAGEEQLASLGANP